jgi:hypothetical protein
MADDVVAMLSPSRRKELALDVLDRAGGGAADRAVREAHQEIERAQERITAMREERAELGRLQRSRRAAVDEDIARQEHAIERWSVQAAAVGEAPPSPPERTPEPSALAGPVLHDTRVALVDRDQAISQVLGERPSTFAAREAWVREAIQLVANETPALDPAPEPATMDDLGMDF